MIAANAAALFPRIVESHPSFQDTLVIKPSEIFDVIVTRSRGNGGWFAIVRWQAILVYGDPMRRKVAAKGNMRRDAETALDGLLCVLADAVWQNFRERAMEEPACFGRHGTVDSGLMD